MEEKWYKFVHRNVGIDLSHLIHFARSVCFQIELLEMMLLIQPVLLVL